MGVISMWGDRGDSYTTDINLRIRTQYNEIAHINRPNFPTPAHPLSSSHSSRVAWAGSW